MYGARSADGVGRVFNIRAGVMRLLGGGTFSAGVAGRQSRSVMRRRSGGGDGSWFRMSSSPHKRRLGPQQRRALELLASNPHGVTEELLMFGHGFSWRMVAALVRARLATVERRVMWPATFRLSLARS
jgi:hypothetical protein